MSKVGKINLDPVEDYLEARHLNTLIKRWLDALSVEPGTRITYCGKIKHFSTWWDNVGPAHDWRLTETLLQKFELHLRSVITERFGQPLSYQTRHAVIRALRMMFRWAAKTRRISRNYGDWVPWPKGDTPQRVAVTQAQLQQLMLAGAESRQPLRDQAIIAFLIGTGCRRSEVAALNVEDVCMMPDGSGTASVTGKRTSANRAGQRTVAFDASTGLYLARYLNNHISTAGPVWMNDDGKPLQAAGIYQMVRRAIKRAGLDEHIRGCHDLRRAFATILGLMHPNSPGWADMIRRQLGHKHYSMTAHYTLMDADDIRTQIVTPLTRQQGRQEASMGNSGIQS